jgi:hypothetical protein
MIKIKKTKYNKGFVILFAVTLSAIILSITLGIANIALKEIKFGTSAKDSSNAFFAADTGEECALFNDKSTSTIFVSSPPSIICNNNSISVAESPVSVWKFTVPGLGSGGQGCANVTVDKRTSLISIVSKGYNIGNASCNSTSTGNVERELKVTYEGSSSSPVPPPSFSCLGGIPINGTACSGTGSGLTQDRNYSLVSSCSASQTDICEAVCSSGYILSGGACVGVPSLVVSSSIISRGGQITVTFKNISEPTSTDWIGLYKSTEGNDYNYIDWVYDDGSPSCSKTSSGGAISFGSCTFTMPNTTGDYNFRIFAEDEYDTKYATSDTVRVK